MTEGFASGGVVPARTWHIIDAGPCDYWIPLTHNPQSRDLLKRTAERLFPGGEGQTQTIAKPRGDEVSGDT